MKVEKIECVLIGVKNLEEADSFFSNLLGTKFSKSLKFEETDTISRMDPLGIELASPLKAGGPLSKLLDSKGEGLIALGLKVSNLNEAVAEMKAKGIRQIGELERGNLRTVLFHPKDTYGVMIELIEYEATHPEIPLINDWERDQAQSKTY